MKSTFIALAAMACAARIALADTNIFTVHEWGTFTSVQGGDGKLMRWRPLQTSDLPPFIYNWMQPGFGRVNDTVFRDKGSVLALQRMETPVIYFYTEQEKTATVDVRFPQGTITEWYPQTTLIGPAISATDKQRATSQSRAVWKNITIASRERGTKRAPVVQFDRSGSHYYTARQAGGNLLQTAPVSTNGVEVEGFLFYRGAGNFETPLRVTVDEWNAVRVANSGNDVLAQLFLVSIHDGKGCFTVLDELPPGGNVPWFNLNTFKKESWKHYPLEQLQGELGAQMTSALVGEGLFEAEAKAMVNTWKDAWFTEEGERVLYILPRRWTDETLPLNVTPKPDATVRVMVGRAEIITPQAVRALANVLVMAKGGGKEAGQRAVNEVRKFGRFNLPAMQLAYAANSNTVLSVDAAIIDASMRPGAGQLEQLYLAWHRECETIRNSSVTGDYIGLPSYRKIVRIGKPALPFLMEKMKADKGMDFMLAFAVVEINGWDKKDFSGGGEQDFRDRVLQKLQTITP